MFLREEELGRTLYDIMLCYYIRRKVIIVRRKDREIMVWKYMMVVYEILERVYGLLYM